MFNVERQKKIMELLSQKKCMSVKNIAISLNASASTIRRDLTELENAGKLKRTFGGVVLEETLTKEVPLLFRQNQNNNLKKIIAAKAKIYINEGSVIFLDASSTVSYLVPILAEFNELTIITNSPKTSIALGEYGIRNYCTGGLLLKHSIAYVGRTAESFVSKINADIMFFSSRGYSPKEGQVSDSSVDESHLREVMLERSKKKYYLCDSSKFDKKYIYNLCTIDMLDGVLTDEDEYDLVK